MVTSLLARLWGSRGRRRILLHVVDDHLLHLDLSREALVFSYAKEMDASHHHGVGDGALEVRLVSYEAGKPVIVS